MTILRLIIFLTWILFFILPFALAHATDFSKAKWEEIDNDEGIKVWSWEPKGSDLFAFKAVGEIKAPIAKVASILSDMPRLKEWTPDLGGAKAVAKISDSERIEYYHVETPFIMKDRDFVLYIKAKWDKETKEFSYNFKSIKDKRFPKTDYVRGVIHASHFLLKATAEGKKTQLTYLVHVDPKGSVAKWIINLFSKGHPWDTLEAVRKQAKKKNVKPLKGVAAMVQGGPPSFFN